MSVAPLRFQLKRQRGWRMPPNSVKVDRSSPCGNPFTVDAHEVEKSLKLHRAWLAGELSDADLMARFPELIAKHRIQRREGVLYRIPSLKGKNLGCWCAEGKPCHGDLLLRLANG